MRIYKKSERYRAVTAQGLEVIRQAFEADGFVTMGNHFLVRKLLDHELILKDGEDEYECIDGNHHLQLLKSGFMPDAIVCVDMVKVQYFLVYNKYCCLILP